MSIHRTMFERRLSLITSDDYFWTTKSKSWAEEQAQDGWRLQGEIIFLIKYLVIIKKLYKIFKFCYKVIFVTMTELKE